MSKCNLLDMPLEILFKVFDNLTVDELKILLKTCKKLVTLITEYNQIVVFEYLLENNNMGYLQLINLNMFPLSILQQYSQKILESGLADQFIYLLDYNVNVTSEVNISVIVSIITRNDVILLKHLIDLNMITKEDLNMLLIIAAQSNNITIVSFLTKYNNLNFVSALDEAIKRNYYDIVVLLLTKVNINYMNGKFIKTAIFNNNFEIVKYLVNNGANINVEGGILLILCITSSATEIYNYFLDKNIILSKEVYKKLLYYLISYDLYDNFKNIINKYKEINKNTIKEIIKFNRKNFMKFLIQNDFHPSNEDIEYAKKLNRENILEIIEQ